MGGRTQGRAHITSVDRGDRRIGHGGDPDPNPNPNPNSTTNAASNSRDSLATAIEHLIQSLPTLRSDCCIYKVPERFRKGNEEFYKPHVVSIGPYHHARLFKHMKLYKLKYVEAFIRRNNINLDNCIGVVRSWEEKVKDYYVDVETIHGHQYFTFLILVDGIFVLELMLRHHFPGLRDSCDRIYHKPRMIEDVYHDILLIENQIPFFVLEGLYEQFGSQSGVGLSFRMLTHEFLKHFVKIDKFPQAAAASSNHEVKHFVDFIRCYYVPPSSQEQRPNESGLVTKTPNKISPSVIALDQAGVNFETVSTTCLLDIKFSQGCLRIPNFVVDDWTETLFRNLIVFEQCHDHPVKYISQFMFLMVCMMTTSKDVDLLIDKGIISSMLGSSQDVSNLFHNITRDVGFGDPYYYSSLNASLNEYCKDRWHMWRANLMRDYFNTPWTIASTGAAIVLLVLTAIQTVCSIMQV